VVELTHPAFKASPVAGRDAIRLSLALGSAEVAIEVPSADASIIAAMVLRAAKNAHAALQGPRAEKRTLTIVSPTAYGASLGRTPTSLILHFRFGDAAIGVELEKTDLRIFGERLLTATSDGAEQ
jgi:hypothetical protein